VPFVFEVIEERPDQHGVDIVEIEA